MTKHLSKMEKNTKIMVISGIVAAGVAAVLGVFKGVTALSSKEEFNKYMPFILDFEGGYTNHPNDRGGETKYGITKKQYPHLDIKALTIQQAKNIYFKDYWTKGKCTLIPKKIRFLYFDTFVNGGGVKVLQRAAGVTQDSVLGQITINAAVNVTPDSYTTARKNRYLDIIANDASQAVFKEGWFNRANKALRIQNTLNGV